MAELRRTGRDDKADRDRNPDPITGAPGSHPIGTGVGAAGAGAAGAAVGAAAGPIGSAVGAVVGAVVGGLAGKGVAEAVNPTEEDAYWREHFYERPYANPGSNYDEYAPAYRYGYTGYTRHPGRSFDEVEPELSRDWDTSRGRSSLKWEHAKLATRDAWQRVSDRIERAVPGDSDRDGK